MEPLPVILLTGFLGAGKTTLLLRWLTESPSTGKRLGVVMNEFGAESVDSQIIQRPGLALQQVAGGCICCAPDHELPNAIHRLVKSGQCDYLVIETSGLADPDNVIDALTDPDLIETVTLQAIITVIDAPWYTSPGEARQEIVLARKQIQYADVLCLSKCDRCDPSALPGAIRQLQQINADARIVKLPFDLPYLGDLLSRPAAHSRLELSPEANPGSPTEQAATPHLHQQYRSLTWRFPFPIDRSRFEAFLSKLEPREVVRAKGFVRFTHQPEKLYLFQTVWGHHIIEEFPVRPHPDPVAVLIGPHLPERQLREQLRILVFGEGHRGLTLS